MAGVGRSNRPETTDCSGTAVCNRLGRGRTPREWRKVGCSVGRSSGGAAGSTASGSARSDPRGSERVAARRGRQIRRPRPAALIIARTTRRSSALPVSRPRRGYALEERTPSALEGVWTGRGDADRATSPPARRWARPSSARFPAIWSDSMPQPTPRGGGRWRGRRPGPSPRNARGHRRRGRLPRLSSRRGARRGRRRGVASSIEPSAVEPGIEPAERPRSTPGGCSGESEASGRRRALERGHGGTGLEQANP